jgi:predicted O-methyltransferase YrrM
MFEVARHYLLYRLGLARAETQTSAAEREALARHAAGKRNCVEIGVWHGVTTRLIRDVMAPDGVLTGVDPFPKGRLGFSFQILVARREIARSRNGTFRLVRLPSAEAAARWDGPVDYLFVDGDHSYAALKADWEGWSRHVVPGGVVCLHDSRPSASRDIEEAGSVTYTREVILRDQRFEVVETADTLTVLRRRRGAVA